MTNVNFNNENKIITSLASRRESLIRTCHWPFTDRKTLKRCNVSSGRKAEKWCALARAYSSERLALSAFHPRDKRTRKASEINSNARYHYYHIFSSSRAESAEWNNSSNLSSGCELMKRGKFVLTIYPDRRVVESFGDRKKENWKAEYRTRLELCDLCVILKYMLYYDIKFLQKKFWLILICTLNFVYFRLWD